MTDLWNSKVTIYNDIADNGVEARHFDRFVIDRCSIQGGLVSRADGTVENIVNATTVWTKNVEDYKTPREYAFIPTDLREQYYTVQVGDFVVFGEVEDIVVDSRDFANLQKKYENNGFKVTSIAYNKNNMAVDNLSFTNA